MIEFHLCRAQDHSLSPILRAHLIEARILCADDVASFAQDSQLGLIKALNAVVPAHRTSSRFVGNPETGRFVSISRHGSTFLAATASGRMEDAMPVFRYLSCGWTALANRAGPQ